jgi:uncharacterized protein YjbI with pentapeptide repeats
MATSEPPAFAGEPVAAAAETDELRSAKIRERAESLKDQADDLAAVRKALDSASATASNLWLTFLSFGTFLAVTVATVTHRDMMLERAVKLPLLNVDLPLVSFFWVAPVLYLIFHAYLLLHFKVLADLVDRYVDLVIETAVSDRVVQSVREQLPSFIMVQVLAAPRKNREGVLGFLMKAALGITIALGPLVLLLYMQLQFLPYHHTGVTWLHRIVIFADLALLAYFSYKLSERRENAFARRSWPIAAASFATISYVSIFVATFPTEFHHGNGLAELTGLRAALLEGDISEVTKRRDSLFSNTLVLIDESLVPEKQADLEAARVTRSFRGRDFAGAVFAKTDLRKVDLTGADLTRVDLSNAKLEGVNFGCGRAKTDGSCARLALANLQGAQMTGATLYNADLTLANLSAADLAGATLNGALLLGARLEKAKLPGASLEGAALAGVSMEFAELQGATLNKADLRGSILTGAQLQGAYLQDSILQGASLQSAEMAGATIDRADMSGASLRFASLRLVRGTALPTLAFADLRDVRLEGDAFSSRELWEKSTAEWLGRIADTSRGNIVRSRLERLEPGFVARAEAGGGKVPEALADFLRNLGSGGTGGNGTASLLDTGAEELPVRSGRSRFLIGILCALEGAPYVSERMIMGGTETNPGLLKVKPEYLPPVAAVGAERRALVRYLLDSSKCAGAAGISQDARTFLQGWAEKEFE